MLFGFIFFLIYRRSLRRKKQECHLLLIIDVKSNRFFGGRRFIWKFACLGIGLFFRCGCIDGRMRFFGAMEKPWYNFSLLSPLLLSSIIFQRERHGSTSKEKGKIVNGVGVNGAKRVSGSVYVWRTWPRANGMELPGPRWIGGVSAPLAGLGGDSASAVRDNTWDGPPKAAPGS